MSVDITTDSGFWMNIKHQPLPMFEIGAHSITASELLVGHKKMASNQ